MTTLLLSCENLSRGFDADPLFEDLSLEIFSGQRIGLVGRAIVFCGLPWAGEDRRQITIACPTQFVKAIATMGTMSLIHGLDQR